ncbi:hypothetical protein E2C01_092704 [Portunus trituberculatus]|uniref:Uncharacterized protein n=1 Tax=Portunus trituberculatus TaxID=210409 RepID=A0A5B7JH40_PORTR|nr:hypothetical protein [Portunus trituberculatus]
MEMKEVVVVVVVVVVVWMGRSIPNRSLHVPSPPPIHPPILLPPLRTNTKEERKFTTTIRKEHKERPTSNRVIRPLNPTSYPSTSTTTTTTTTTITTVTANTKERE